MRDTDIPSMGGTEIGPALRELASGCAPHTAIVEVGCWLGAGTWELSQGALLNGDDPTIHVFDRFRASRSEVEKAAAAGVHLKEHMDTLPVVRKFLHAAPTAIKFNKGDLFAARWGGGPIGLYVDDAAKTEMTFSHILRVFGPHWVAGKTCLALMDFHFWKKNRGTPREADLRFQSNFIEQHPDVFESIEDLSAIGTSAAFFRYTRPMDFSTIPAPKIGLKKKIRMALNW